LLAFLVGHEKTIKEKALSGKFAIAVPIGVTDSKRIPDPIRASAFVDLVHAVANSNEFAYRN
jgi:hypothetical protein